MLLQYSVKKNIFSNEFALKPFLTDQMQCCSCTPKVLTDRCKGSKTLYTVDQGKFNLKNTYDTSSYDTDMTGCRLILTWFRLDWKSHMMFLHAIKKQLCSSSGQRQRVQQMYWTNVCVSFVFTCTLCHRFRIRHISTLAVLI